MLDRYLHTQARQDIQRRVAQVYVLLDEDQRTILGYHTLSNGSVLLSICRRSCADGNTLLKFLSLLGRLAVAPAARDKALAVCY